MQRAPLAEWCNIPRPKTQGITASAALQFRRAYWVGSRYERAIDSGNHGRLGLASISTVISDTIWITLGCTSSPLTSLLWPRMRLPDVHWID